MVDVLVGVQACAPRYVYHSRSDDRRDPIGACYVSRSHRDGSPVYNRYSPCRKGQLLQQTCSRQFEDGGAVKIYKWCRTAWRSARGVTVSLH